MKEILLQNVEDALKIIDENFSKATLSETLRSIKAQLVFIKNDLENSEDGKFSADRDDVERIILGVQSVREIETQNEELADLLCDIDFEYKKLYGISNLP